MLKLLRKFESAGTKLNAIPRRNVWTAGGLGDDFSPHKYTSGRWLLRDDQQCQARHISFDFNKLCDRAIACSNGARDIVECVKVEGGFNRAFLLQLDNGASLVARVPFSIAGPARLTTNSEVATMEYIRNHTSIPVPVVLDWSDDPDNAIGTEYIIMESAKGVQLHQRWPSMDSHEHMQAVKALAQMTKEMSLLRFPAYGSLYFADAPIEKSSLIHVSDGFCIGPHCGHRYWPGTPGDERSYQRRPPNRGPWSTHEEYCHGMIDAGVSRIPPTTPPRTLEFKGTVSEHLHLAGAAERIMQCLVQSETMKSIDRPMLLHRDMHKRNMFVSDDDPAKITCLMDWQSSSVQPVHSYSGQTPDLCNYPDIWDDAELEDPPSKAQQKIVDDVSLCRQMWEVMMRYIPELHKARTVDQDFLRVLRNVSSAWVIGAVPFRAYLIQLSGRWSSQLLLHGSCPYQPTPEELALEERLWEDFETMHHMTSLLTCSLITDDDGWIPIGRWEETKSEYSSLFSQWLEAVVKTGEMTEDKAMQFWPFDSPS